MSGAIAYTSPVAAADQRRQTRIRHEGRTLNAKNHPALVGLSRFLHGPGIYLCFAMSIRSPGFLSLSNASRLNSGFVPKFMRRPTSMSVARR
jgi:hypothetical protein